MGCANTAQMYADQTLLLSQCRVGAGGIKHELPVKDDRSHGLKSIQATPAHSSSPRRSTRRLECGATPRKRVSFAGATGAVANSPTRKRRNLPLWSNLHNGDHWHGSSRVRDRIDGRQRNLLIIRFTQVRRRTSEAADQNRDSHGAGPAPRGWSRCAASRGSGPLVDTRGSDRGWRNFGHSPAAGEPPGVAGRTTCPTSGPPKLSRTRSSRHSPQRPFRLGPRRSLHHLLDRGYNARGRLRLGRRDAWMASGGFESSISRSQVT